MKEAFKRSPEKSTADVSVLCNVVGPNAKPKVQSTGRLALKPLIDYIQRPLKNAPKYNIVLANK